MALLNLFIYLLFCGQQAGNYQILIALTFRLQTKTCHILMSPGTFVALNICNPLKFFK